MADKKGSQKKKANFGKNAKFLSNFMKFKSYKVKLKFLYYNLKTMYTMYITM